MGEGRREAKKKNIPQHPPRYAVFFFARICSHTHKIHRLGRSFKYRCGVGRQSRTNSSMVGHENTTLPFISVWTEGNHKSDIPQVYQVQPVLHERAIAFCFVEYHE